jgi:hypothetical protein
LLHSSCHSLTKTLTARIAGNKTSSIKPFAYLAYFVVTFWFSSCGSAAPCISRSSFASLDLRLLRFFAAISFGRSVNRSQLISIHPRVAPLVVPAPCVPYFTDAIPSLNRSTSGTSSANLAFAKSLDQASLRFKKCKSEKPPHPVRRRYQESTKPTLPGFLRKGSKLSPKLPVLLAASGYAFAGQLSPTLPHPQVGSMPTSAPRVCPGPQPTPMAPGRFMAVARIFARRINRTLIGGQ